MEAVTRSVISVPGVTYYNDLDFGTWSLDLLFSALADDAAKGTQRLAISGRAGPMVKAHLAEPGPLPPAVLHLWNCAVHQKKSVTQADTPFQASVNLYKPESLMVPHKDGRGTKALVFSLGAACSVLKFFFRPNESSRTYTRVFEAPSADELVVSYLLEPGSLLVMEGEAFTDWVHFVEAKECDIVSEDLANFSQLKLAKGESIARRARVSVVIWPDWRTGESSEQKN